MKRRILIIVFSLLSLALICFIFGNSLQDAAASNEKSGAVAQILAPESVQEMSPVQQKSFHKLVRKMAHFAEFAALGFCLGGFSLSIGGKRLGRWLLPLVGAGIIAAADEFIQNFTGRNPMVKDVALDFAGAVFGLMALAFIYWLIQRILTRKKRET